MRISDMTELREYLAQVQSRREAEVHIELSPALSARMNDAALLEILIRGLYMARGIKHRIIRSRGRGAALTAKLHYRDGIRMLADDSLTEEEVAMLELARSIVANFLPLNEEERFQHVYDWICRNVQYVHTAPGQKGYERLVGAAGALADSQANCQGYADVLYLLCGLCGIVCEYRIGPGVRRMHVWNAVCVNGAWLEVDASIGARLRGV